MCYLGTSLSITANFDFDFSAAIYGLQSITINAAFATLAYGSLISTSESSVTSSPGDGSLSGILWRF
jgi:hypothetical protein